MNLEVAVRRIWGKSTLVPIIRLDSPFVGHTPGCDGARKGNWFSAELGPGLSTDASRLLSYVRSFKRSYFQAKFALLDDPTFAVVAVNEGKGGCLEDGL